MNNLFEGAKFGDKFITRDNRVAVYLHYVHSIQHHELITEDMQDIECDSNGLYYEDDNRNDIVSIYQEQIDKEKLDELAIESLMYEIDNNYPTIGDSLEESYLSGFKAGYLKAMKE